MVHFMFLAWSVAKRSWNPNSFGGHKFYNYDDHPSLQALPLREIPQWKTNLQQILALLESVHFLCRDGADTQYMQYLTKSQTMSSFTIRKTHTVTEKQHGRQLDN